jgi:VanZ family protein
MSTGTATMRRSLIDVLRDPVVRNRIGTGLVVLTLSVAFFVTLYPFRFSVLPDALSRIDWRPYYPGHNDRDLIQNLLMLAPLGIGLAMVRHGRATVRRIAGEAAGFGVTFALIVETLQIFERGRFPQVADVWRNGLGCVVGAVIAGLVLRWLDHERT